MTTTSNNQHQPAPDATDAGPGPVECEPARSAARAAAIDLVAWVAVAVFLVASVNAWDLSPWLLIVAGIAIGGAVVSAERLGTVISEVRRARNREEGAVRR